MYYILKLFDANGNWLIEGVYTKKSKAEEKANKYMLKHRDRIRFYDIDIVPLDSDLVNEDIIEALYEGSY